MQQLLNMRISFAILYQLLSYVICEYTNSYHIKPSIGYLRLTNSLPLQKHTIVYTISNCTKIMKGVYLFKNFWRTIHWSFFKKQSGPLSVSESEKEGGTISLILLTSLTTCPVTRASQRYIIWTGRQRHVQQNWSWRLAQLTSQRDPDSVSISDQIQDNRGTISN